MPTKKQFAQRMITDHTKTSNELKDMVPADMKSALPTGLDDSSQKKVELRPLNSRLQILITKGICVVLGSESTPIVTPSRLAFLN
jgi:hypothetical protein